MRFLHPGAVSRYSRRVLRAFTLLEILVVLAILGLLVGVLVVNVTGNLERGSSDAARLAVTVTYKAPLTAYRIDLGNFPTTAEGLQALITAPGNKADRWRGPYVEGKIQTDPWGEPYVYRSPGTKNPTSYDLFSKGPDRSEGTADDIGNW